MKKQYQAPSLTVMNIQGTCFICLSTDSNAGIKGGNTGSSGTARGREYNDWDD